VRVRVRVCVCVCACAYRLAVPRVRCDVPCIPLLESLAVV
jgi:hypothetical protein